MNSVSLLRPAGIAGGALALVLLVSVPAAASTIPIADDIFTFDESLTASSGVTVEPYAACEAPPDPSAPCNATTDFGTEGEDGYWQWSSTDEDRGGGFEYNPSQSIGTSYTISLKFQIATESTGGSYTKIIDYQNFDSDAGTYLSVVADPDWMFDFYSAEGTGPEGSEPTLFGVNEILDVAVVRDGTVAPATFTAYVRNADGDFVEEFTFADEFDEAVSFLDGAGHTVLGFFSEDGTGGEAALAGRIFDLRVWYDTALTEDQLNNVSAPDGREEEDALAATGPNTSAATVGLLSALLLLTVGAALVARRRRTSLG